MAFHSTNFGSFSAHLTGFVDNSGRVPQHGDKAREFNYAGLFGAGPRSMGMRWAEFVAAAEDATTQAQAALSAWRDWVRSPTAGAPKSSDMFGRV